MSESDQTAGRRDPSAPATVRVWDGPTRLFHWSLVVLIALAYLTRKANPDLTWHMRIGYAILILITFRILWGIVGSSTARFASFADAPGTALRYGIDVVLRRPRHFLGHNALGGTMVFSAGSRSRAASSPEIQAAFSPNSRGMASR